MELRVIRRACPRSKLHATPLFKTKNRTLVKKYRSLISWNLRQFASSAMRMESSQKIRWVTTQPLAQMVGLLKVNGRRPSVNDRRRGLLQCDGYFSNPNHQLPSTLVPRFMPTKLLDPLPKKVLPFAFSTDSFADKDRSLNLSHICT